MIVIIWRDDLWHFLKSIQIFTKQFLFTVSLKKQKLKIPKESHNNSTKNDYFCYISVEFFSETIVDLMYATLQARQSREKP